MNKLLSFLLTALLLIPIAAHSHSALPQADLVAVFKSERALALLHEGKIYKIYDIVLGKDPVGHKLQEGDNRTPEGTYMISNRNPNSRYYLSLQISYPNETDIAIAEALGVDPGKHIMIHGMKDQYRHKKSRRSYPSKATDWTEGCIAVSNKDMHELWHLIADGTPIKILP